LLHVNSNCEAFEGGTDTLGYLAGGLDLTNVRMKLADPEEGKGLSEEELDLAEAEYRKFLALHLMHPDADIVPCHLVDDIWHQHILDTICREDCNAIFGRFLDHFPYFGMRGDDDAQALCDAYEDTLLKYEEAFGAPPEGTWRVADAKAKLPDAVQATEVTLNRLVAIPDIARGAGHSRPS
jgi:hypothetical protein